MGATSANTRGSADGRKRGQLAEARENAQPRVQGAGETHDQEANESPAKFKRRSCLVEVHIAAFCWAVDIMSPIGSNKMFLKTG